MYPVCTPLTQPAARLRLCLASVTLCVLCGEKGRYHRPARLDPLADRNVYPLRLGGLG